MLTVTDCFEASPLCEEDCLENWTNCVNEQKRENVQTGFSLLVRDLERKYGDFGLFLTGHT